MVLGGRDEKIGKEKNGDRSDSVGDEQGEWCEIESVTNKWQDGVSLHCGWLHLPQVYSPHDS